MLFLYIFAEAERAGQKGVQNTSLFIPPIHRGALLHLTPAIHTRQCLLHKTEKKKRKQKLKDIFQSILTAA